MKAVILTRANFAKYHTFTFYNGQLNSRNPTLNNELVSFAAAWGTRVVRVSIAREHENAESDATKILMSCPRNNWTVERYMRLQRPPRVPGYPSTSSHFRDATPGKLDDMVRKSLEKYPPKPK